MERLERDLRAGLVELLDRMDGDHPTWAASPAAARVSQPAAAGWLGRRALLAVAAVLVGVLLAASGLLFAGGLRLFLTSPLTPSPAPVPAPSFAAMARHPRSLVPTGIVSAPSLDFSGARADARAVADREGNVWVFASGFLMRLDPDEGKSRAWTASDDAAFRAGSMAAPAAGGGVWLATQDELLWFDGGSFRDAIDGPPGMPTGAGVAEAPDGTLWAVTERGVFHWDGATWAPAAAGRTSTAAGPIAVDHAGQVWVADYHYPGPVGDGVSVYDGTSWRTYTAANAAPLSGRGSPDDPSGTWVSNTPQAIVVAPDGSVWVATEGGLARFDGASWRTFDAAETGFATAPASLAVAPDGTVWVTGYACEGAVVRVARFDGRAWTVSGPEDGLPAAEPGGCLGASVAATGERVVVVAGDVAYRLAGERWERVWPAPAAISGPASPWSFVAVSGDELWATRDGLWHWQAGDWVSGPTDAGLPEVPAGFATLAMGPDGRVWLAGDIGVAVRDGDHWTLVDNRPAKTVAPAADGTAWVGGDAADGDVRTLRFDGSAWSSQAAPETPFLGVGSLAIARDGTVWATAMGGWGSDPNGCLARLVGDRWEKVWPFDPGWDCTATVVASPSGDIWVTGEAQPPAFNQSWGLNPVAAQFDGGAWTVYGEADGLPGVSGGQALAFTPDGTAWVTTWEGIARLDGTRWTMVVDDGRYYGPIAAAPDGSLWVAGPAGLEVVAGTGAAP
jgi:hypothetical protein